MNDTLDRTSQEAVTALATALQASLTSGASAAIEKAFEAPLSETQEAARRLHVQASALSELEPSLRQALRTGLSELQGHLSPIEAKLVALTNALAATRTALEAEHVRVRGVEARARALSWTVAALATLAAGLSAATLLLH